MRRANLTLRETAILELIEHSNKEIAARLEVTEQAVKNHLTMVRVRTGCGSRAQLAMYAIAVGLVRTPEVSS